MGILLDSTMKSGQGLVAVAHCVDFYEYFGHFLTLTL